MMDCVGRHRMFPLADLALGGNLEAELRRWRTEGRTYRAIAASLRLRGIEVSYETVRVWCRDLGIITKDTAA